jgi:hypothetical protein
MNAALILLPLRSDFSRLISEEIIGSVGLVSKVEAEIFFIHKNSMVPTEIFGLPLFINQIKREA